MKNISLFLLFFLLTGIPSAFAQSRELTGKVTDKKDKSSLPGVTVMIKGTTTGTATDIDGNYKIPVQDGDILVFSFVGLKTEEIQVKGQKVLNVALESSAEMLDEVVAIGYGVRKKGSITGSVSTVKSDKLENTPVASFAQALQGQAAGLQVFTNSGQPDAGSSFSLRGTNSISAGNSPLFIIDGMQVSSRDFASYNPSDFESISILKDASSTAIYGTRATNGVVIITTKRGKMGEKANITARAQMGVSMLAYGKWDMMNTQEKLDYEEEIGLHDNDPNYNRADWENTDIDWRDMIFRNNALMQHYELSISGASEKTRYYLSAGMHDQDGITYGTFFHRYTVRLNLETQANNWLKAGMNITAGYEESNNSYENEYSPYTPLGGVRKMNPYWNPYRPDGSIASIGDGSWKGGTYENPIEFINSEQQDNNKAKLTGSLFLEVSPIKNLVIKSMGGIDYAGMRETFTRDPEYPTNQGEGSIQEAYTRRYTLQITNTADYSFSFDETHNFRILLGQEASYYRGNNIGVRGVGITDKRLLVMNNATSFRNGTGSDLETTFLSFFGRLEYNFLEKYYFDTTIRRDGSSRFGSNSKWGNFWSVGMMWNLGRENFMQSLPFLTNSQLSFTYGKQGNSTIPDYIHLATVSNVNYGDNQGIIPNTIGNPDLTWENTYTMNIGLKLGFWNRVNLSADVYHKITEDMLMEVPYSLSSGFSKEWDNVGRMRNVGIDFDINADIIRNDDWRWNISANFSYNKNKILKLYEDQDEYTDSAYGIKYEVGHSVGEFFINRFAGVNPANGDALYYTHDGKIINQIRSEDAVITPGKSYFAPWSGGFGTSLSYRGLTLSAQFSWVADRYMLNNDRFFTESNGRYANENQSKKLLYNRWKQPGDIAEVPRHGVYITTTDSRLLENASFLRLKNVNLTWRLPQKWISRTGFFESIQIYGQAENVFTITEFSGFDPEFNGNAYAATYPLSRQITCGVEFNF